MSHELYRHFDAAGQLLYVGISASSLRRLLGHRRTASWVGEIARVTIDRFSTLGEAAMAERSAIFTEHPLHNHWPHGWSRDLDADWSQCPKCAEARAKTLARTQKSRAKKAES